MGFELFSRITVFLCTVLPFLSDFRTWSDLGLFLVLVIFGPILVQNDAFPSNLRANSEN